MERIVIKTNRVYLFVLLIGFIGFSVLGLLMIFQNRDMQMKVAGWGILIFCGACIPLFIWRIIDSRPRLIIDDNGIYDRNLAIGVIPWNEIEGAYIKSLYGQDFICMQLKDYDKYLSKSNSLRKSVSAANTALGFSPITLSFGRGVNADVHQVYDLIMKKSAKK